MRLGTQSIRVWRAGAPTEDEYHNQIPGDPTGVLVDGCSVQPGAGAEYVLDRSATTTAWTVWAPIAADVRDDDEIEYPAAPTAAYETAKRYPIKGPVDRWEVGTPLDHLVIRLERTQG